jgi:sugar porter (SP) family MFS transporter
MVPSETILNVTPEAPPKLNAYLVKSTVVAALSGLLVGFVTAVISGTTHDLTLVYHLTPGSIGITVASALWGAVLGALFAGIPADRYGPRRGLGAVAALFLGSGLGCALAWSWPSLVAFRFLAGLAIGGSCVLGPMYIAEIAPAKWRGRLVGFFQVNVVVGILLAFVSNYIVGLFQLGQLEWRWKLGVSAVLSVPFFVLLFAIPRSPRWLVKKGYVDEAREVFLKTGEERCEQELREILESVSSGGSAESLFCWKYRLPIFLAVSIGMFSQLSGVNAVWYYLNDIFARAGFSKVSSDLQAVTVGIVNLIAVILAMSVIDRIGRKTLLLIGSVGCVASLAGVSAVFFSGAHANLLLWCLIGFIGFFSFSQGAVIWVYISEVFPNNVRAKGQSLGSFSHWFMNAIVTWLFPLMAVSSEGYPFLIFSAMMALQFFVVMFVYPETKQVSLEAMQQKLGIG